MQAALQLAEEHGIPVFPCRPDKRPYTRHGLKDASANLEQVARWWQEWPHALVAAPTGLASKLLVVDVDPKGTDWYGSNEARLDCGRIHKTQRGHHLLYRMPDVEVRNSAGKVAPGIDVRGEGGYVIWWPAHGLEAIGGLGDLTSPPDWLLTEIRTPEKPAPANGHTIAKGGRNSALTSLAGKMRRAGASGEEILAALGIFNQRCASPLSDAELISIATSVSRYSPTEARQQVEVQVMTMANIERQTLAPLWPGRFWRGKTALLAGDPGLGKSLATLDIAARITRGKAWPASEHVAPLGDVVLLSAEDDAGDTLRPRLESADADLNRVHVITEVSETDLTTGERRRRTFTLARHLDHLERIFVERKPLLLVIDPITAYLSRESDSHNTADVRAELSPLADLAQRHGAAVLMVSHLNKATTMQAIYRVTGSVAFVAAARSAFGVLRDPNDGERRLFLPLKNNLGKDTGGLAYRIAFDGRAPHVDWEQEPVDVDIDEITTTARTNAKKSSLDEVSDWVRDELRDGPVAAKTIWRHAEEANYGEKRVRAALKAVGAESGPMGYAGAWHYKLPESARNTGSFSRPRLTQSCRDLPSVDAANTEPRSLSDSSESARGGNSGQESAVKMSPENPPTLEGMR